MTAALRANGVPTDLYSVLRRDPKLRDPGHEQTTLLGSAGLRESDPFGGHGWEESNTHIVINTGLLRRHPCGRLPGWAPRDVDRSASL